VIALEGMLELSNVACDIVFDGYSVIESLEMNNNNKECKNHKPYKLLILDNSMPMSGIDVA
jgi:hypothetical protein